MEQSPESLAEWYATRRAFPFGTVVSGIVTHRAPMAVCLDLGGGVLGTLLATRMYPPPSSFDDIPPFGRTVTATVIGYSDSCHHIILHQPHPPEA